MINKVTVSIATMKEREESLKDLVEILLPQVDTINIYLHYYEEVPEFLINDKINCLISETDNGDLDKFHWIQDITGWHFILDDDLIISSDYVKDTIEFITANDTKSVYSYHGVVPFRLPIASYYLDRFVYPCLGDVEKLTEVKLLGTGVMAYYTEEPFAFDYTNLPKNMADIHFALFLNSIGKKMFVIPHKEEYINHSQKVDLEKTIYSQSKDFDYIQTTFINNNPKEFQTPKIFPNFPLVSIIVVNSRNITDRLKVKRCLDSIRDQLYPNIEVIKIDNLEKLVTIGKAFNDGVKQAKGDLVLFVGDDDYIVPEYVFSLVDRLLRNNPNAVGVTSYITVFNDTGYRANMLIPTGMWYRNFLLENPFKEYLTRYVDSELFARVKEQELITEVAGHQYGYFYNSHDGQVSGNKKLISDTPETASNQVSIESILKHIKSY